MRLRYAETRGPEALTFRRYQHDRHGVIETLSQDNVVHVKGSSLPRPLPVQAFANKPIRKRSESARRLKVMVEPAADTKPRLERGSFLNSAVGSPASLRRTQHGSGD